MNIKKIIFGIFLVFSLYIGIKLFLLFLQPTPKLYETIDGKLYLESNDKIKIANAIGKAFSENIIPSVLQDACNKVGGYYYNNTCYIGKLTIIDGKGIISPGVYNYLTDDQLMKLINACNSGNCPVGYVGYAGTKDDYVHYNVTNYKNNVKPRPVGSMTLLEIFNISNSEIEEVLKNHIANALGTDPSNIDVKIVNKQLVGKIGDQNSLFEKNLAGYVEYSITESYSTYAYWGHNNELPQEQWIIGLFNNPNKEYLFLPANFRFNYTIKKDPNYKGFANIITGCNGRELLNKIFPQYCNYTGPLPANRKFYVFKCDIGNGLSWSTLWNKIARCKYITDISNPKVFYLNYSIAKPGMLTLKEGIKFKFYYPYVDCGYDQAASGTYIVKADGFNIKAIIDNVTGNVVKTCVDAQGNSISCTELGLKTKNKNKILKLSGFNGISFKLNLNQQIVKYEAYKITGEISYLISVTYNGKEEYYRVDLVDDLNPLNKLKISECTNRNICNPPVNVYYYKNNILTRIEYDENTIVYDKEISKIFGEE